MVAAGSSAVDYASELVRIAREFVSSRRSLALEFAESGSLESRIKWLLDRTTGHLPIGWRLSWLSFAVALVATLGVTSMQLVSRSQLATADEPAAKRADDAETVGVTGIVVDEQDKPVAGAKVVAMIADEVSTTSDQKGAFTLRVPPKTKFWTIVARTANDSHMGYWESDHGDHQATADKIAEPIRIAIKASRAISVSVVDAGDKPLANIEAVCQADYHKMTIERTDAAGKATLRVPADYRLQSVFAYAPGVGFDYQLFRQKYERGIDAKKLPQDYAEPLKFVLNGIRPVTVRVTDTDNLPMAGVKVSPWYFELPGKGHPHNSHMNLSDMKFVRTTDDRGIANFDFLPQGIVGGITFWARLDDRHFQPDRAHWDTESDAKEITTVLHRKAQLTGRVLLPDGKPAAKAQVHLVGDGRAFDSSFRQSIETDEDGKFDVYVNSDVYCMMEARLDRFVSNAVQLVIVEGASPAPIELQLAPASRLLGRITEGKDGKPVVDQTVYIQHHPTPDYYHLPKAEQKFPIISGQKSIVPYLSESLKTDSDGQYEYFVGPGSYYVMGPNQNAPRPKVEVTGLGDYETDIHADRPENIVLKGTVLSSTGKPVANAKILGRSTGSGRDFLETDGDATGQYSVRRSGDKLWVQAEDPESKEVSITVCEADVTHLDLFVSPPAIVRGKLVDADTDKPLADQSIQYLIPVTLEEKSAGGGQMFTTIFGGVTKTDTEGRFELTRVVPGWRYNISWVHSFHRGGIVADEATFLKAIEPKEAGTVDLGILKAKKK